MWENPRVHFVKHKSHFICIDIPSSKAFFVKSKSHTCIIRPQETNSSQLGLESTVSVGTQLGDVYWGDQHPFELCKPWHNPSCEVLSTCHSDLQILFTTAVLAQPGGGLGWTQPWMAARQAHHPLCFRGSKKRKTADEASFMPGVWCLEQNSTCRQLH